MNKLKTHLLTRFLGKPFDADEEAYSNAQLAQVIITNNHIYQHQTLRVNYTSYDLRREQDSINLRTNSDIMLLSNEDHDPDEDPPHPYWYAHVLGIFHARVVYVDPEKGTYLDKEMEFLWVRWYGMDGTSRKFGWEAKNLPRVGFIDPKRDTTMAFGFVDPTLVLRAVHLIPDETGRRSHNGIPQSKLARPNSEDGMDWNYFFVNV